MKKQRTLCLVIALGTFLLLAPHISAASFVGKVIEVNEGDLITVSNLNRPVRVRLLGIDAPELTQPFGDISRQHLADLVLDKAVMVQYAGYTDDYALKARVTLEDRDICAQMIRDGAAWFEPKAPVFTSADREIYSQSEAAARSERRGLWQLDNPVAPWEFVQASKQPAPVANAVAADSTPRKSSNSSLTTEGLRWATIATARPSGVAASESPENFSASEANGQWRTLRPAGEKFSVLVPVDGKSIDLPVPSGDKMVNFHMYMGRHNTSVYQVMWVTGPTMGESDAEAISGTIQGFLRGMAGGYDSRRGQGAFACETPEPVSISMKGYTGREFDFRECTLPGITRVFTRVVGGERRMYVFGVFYKDRDANATRFLKSFEFLSTEGTTARNKN